MSWRAHVSRKAGRLIGAVVSFVLGGIAAAALPEMRQVGHAEPLVRQRATATISVEQRIAVLAATTPHAVHERKDGPEVGGVV